MSDADFWFLTVQEEDSIRSPLLKIWNLDRFDKRSGSSAPALLRSTKVQQGNRPHPVCQNPSVPHCHQLNFPFCHIGIVGRSLRYISVPSYRSGRRRSPPIPLSRPIHILIIHQPNFLTQTQNDPRVPNRTNNRPRIPRTLSHFFFWCA